MNWDKKLYIFSLSLNIKECCKAIKVDQNITCIGFRPQWVDAHVNNFLTIQARELKFCVCYLREKSAPLTNFQPNWTTRSKVSAFSDFICRVSLPVVPPPPSYPYSHKKSRCLLVGPLVGPSVRHNFFLLHNFFFLQQKVFTEIFYSINFF